jgi:16S rRNA (guanine527-N7)-methyltransferase
VPEREGPVSRETSLAALREVLSPLPAATVSRLEVFEKLLRDVAVPRGFVAAGDADRLFDRHVADSARAAAAVETTDRRALDAGSGAGLPGIPVAIVRPELEFVLAEPRTGRVAFLELAIERLELPNVHIHPGRIEDLAPGGFDLVLARAFAPAAAAWRRLAPLLAQTGRVVYFAGDTADTGRGCSRALCLQRGDRSLS